MKLIKKTIFLLNNRIILLVLGLILLAFSFNIVKAETVIYENVTQSNYKYITIDDFDNNLKRRFNKYIKNNSKKVQLPYFLA